MGGGETSVVFNAEEQARIKSPKDFLDLLEEKLGCLDKVALDAARPRIEPLEMIDLLGPVMLEHYGKGEADQIIEAMNRRRPSSWFEQDICLDIAKSAARTALSVDGSQELTDVGVLTALSFNANHYSVALTGENGERYYHLIAINVPLFRIIREISMYAALIILTAQRLEYGKAQSFAVFQLFTEYCQTLMGLGDGAFDQLPLADYKAIDSLLLPEAMTISALATTVATSFILLHELGHRYLHGANAVKPTDLPIGVARYCQGIMDISGRSDREHEADSFAVQSLLAIRWSDHVPPELFRGTITEEMWDYGSAVGVGTVFAAFELLKPRTKLWQRMLGLSGSTPRARFNAVVKGINGRPAIWNKASLVVKMAAYLRTTDGLRRSPPDSTRLSGAGDRTPELE